MSPTEEDVLAKVLTAILALGILGCGGKLHVEHITDPVYPYPARYEGAQGTVVVNIAIASDGHVIYAKGSGAPEVLVKAAEENAKQWIFGPFPPACEFPIYHSIRYVYKLEGKPKAVAIQPVIRTFLPDRIEISAVPLVSDYPPLTDYKPIPKTK